MVSRASGGLGDDTVEPQYRQIQFVGVTAVNVALG